METAGKQIEDDELRLAMKDSGLGTPATRAAIIETLLTREYVRREKKALVATPKGVALITMLRSPLLTSAELTGQWEQKLARIVHGEYERETFMREVRAMVADLVAQIAGTAMERRRAVGACRAGRERPGLRGARLPAVRGGGARRRLPHRARGAHGEIPRLRHRQRGVRLHHRQAEECQAAQGYAGDQVPRLPGRDAAAPAER